MAKKETKAPADLIDKPDVRLLAAPVSGVVEIRNVSLIRFGAERDPEADPREQEIRVRHNSTTRMRGENLLVVVHVDVITEKDGEKNALQLSADFLLTYVIKGEGNVEFADNNLHAFGELNGVFNAWPYIREFVQSSSTRMGLGPLTLPVFRPPTHDTHASKQSGKAKRPSKPKAIGKRSPKKKSV